MERLDMKEVLRRIAGSRIGKRASEIYGVLRPISREEMEEIKEKTAERAYQENKDFLQRVADKTGKVSEQRSVEIHDKVLRGIGKHIFLVTSEHALERTLRYMGIERSTADEIRKIHETFLRRREAEMEFGSELTEYDRDLLVEPLLKQLSLKEAQRFLKIRNSQLQRFKSKINFQLAGDMYYRVGKKHLANYP